MGKGEGGRHLLHRRSTAFLTMRSTAVIPSCMSTYGGTKSATLVAALEELVDAGGERSQFVRLAENGKLSLVAGDELLAAVAAREQHWNVAVRALYLAGKFQAAHDGHDDVGKDQIDLVFLKEGEGLATVLSVQNTTT